MPSPAIPLLPYCLIDGAAVVTPPEAGVRGAPVTAMTVDGLRCYYSRLADDETPPATDRGDALAFHAVLDRLLGLTGLIPFRFPTLVQDEQTLAESLRTRVCEYGDTLRRVGDAVQMDVRLRMGGETIRPASGRAYLEGRYAAKTALDEAASRIERATGAIVRSWRRREYPHEIRCYALVNRHALESFRQALLTAEVEPPVSVVISGPWPAWEFMSP